MAKHFFTSESVTEGHPDKLCEQAWFMLWAKYLQAAMLT